MRIRCCDRVREGKFCSECGRRLVSGRVKKYRAEIRRLRYGIDRYITAHHKKMAGSTIQYNISWLEDLLEISSPPLDK